MSLDDVSKSIGKLEGQFESLVSAQNQYHKEHRDTITVIHKKID